jgi:hypothetical protein
VSLRPTAHSPLVAGTQGPRSPLRRGCAAPPSARLELGPAGKGLEERIGAVAYRLLSPHKRR